MSRLHTHYDNLKVARNAPPEVIRAAYKTLCQKYHPDKNPGDARAAEIMAILNSSYAALSDPDSRQMHDAWIERQESMQNEEPARAASEIKDPPQSPPQSPPPEKPKVFFTLLRGLSAYWVFFVFGGFLLYSCVSEKRSPSVGPKPYVSYPPPEFPVADSSPSAKDAATAAAEAAAAAAAAVAATANYEKFGADSKKSQVLSAPEKFSGCQVPDSDPHGRAWPPFAQYVDGFEILNTDGRSKITIDNSQNDSNVFVKIVSLDGREAYPIRSIYIEAYGKFTAEGISPGAYDVRYRDLKSGCLSRSDQFNLTEKKLEDGVQYSAYTITLYKVVDGNMETFPLDESGF